MQSLFATIRSNPWMVFGLLMAGGTVCALIELQHPTAALFMAAGILVMWKSGTAARSAE